MKKYSTLIKRWLFIFCFISVGLLEAETLEKIIVFSAASTTNAVSQIGELYSTIKKVKIVTSFAASSTLAKQIENGAPADIYISANPNWMEYLEKKGLIEAGTRFDLLTNRIVLIAPVESSLDIKISKSLDLSAFLGDGRLSMGDPDHTPCGIYSKKALESLGLWNDISAKVIRAKDVRSALYFVEQNEAPLGIVYATDAKISKRVKILDTFPENLHPPVLFQAGVVKHRISGPVEDFIVFLKSADSKNVFSAYGFTVK